MDLGIGWIERHETISKEVIRAILIDLELNPYTILSGDIMIGNTKKWYLFICENKAKHRGNIVVALLNIRLEYKGTLDIP